MSTGDQAAALVELFAEFERLAGAGRALAARRVDETSLWRSQGHRSAAHWMAATTGTSLGAAVGTLQTARRLEELPAVAQAYRAGELSAVQVQEIAGAAAADPSAERTLLEAARADGVNGLRQRCRQVRAAAERDEAAHHRALHRSRHLRHWCDPDGAFRMDLRTITADGAVVLAVLRPHQRRVFAEARAAGRREAAEAYDADALVALARGAASGPRAMVQVRVDHAALVRGHTEADEVCEVPGVGPIPVATARELRATPSSRGSSPTASRFGRWPTWVAPSPPINAPPSRHAIRNASSRGCHTGEGLEIDHVDGWALTRTTTVDRLARLCRFHHNLKTYCGDRLEGAPGAWRWLRPEETVDEPRPPPA